MNRFAQVSIGAGVLAMISAGAVAVASSTGGSAERAGAVASTMSDATRSTLAGGFGVDKVHSGVVFRIKHRGVSWFYGRFNDIDGEFHLDDADPAASHVSIVVATGSIDTANASRDRHLKSDDFFNAQQFPDLKFESTGVRKTGENTFSVTGNLTMLGKSKEITVPIESTGQKTADGKEIAGLECVFTINRSEWGMTRYVQEGALSDEVRLMVSLEGSR